MTDEERFIEIGMAAYHRVSVALNMYDDLTPREGRVPFADLPDIDQEWWRARAQQAIDSGKIDMTTHRPYGARDAD